MCDCSSLDTWESRCISCKLKNSKYFINNFRRSDECIKSCQSFYDSQGEHIELLNTPSGPIWPCGCNSQQITNREYEYKIQEEEWLIFVEVKFSSGYWQVVSKNEFPTIFACCNRCSLKGLITNRSVEVFRPTNSGDHDYISQRFLGFFETYEFSRIRTDDGDLKTFILFDSYSGDSDTAPWGGVQHSFGDLLGSLYNTADIYMLQLLNAHLKSTCRFCSCNLKCDFSDDATTEPLDIVDLEEMMRLLNEEDEGYESETDSHSSFF